MEVGKVLSSGYVLYDEKNGHYVTSNVGIFKTKRNAEKQREVYSKYYRSDMKVVKVNVVVAK